MLDISFKLFGTPILFEDGQQVALTRRKATVLLTYLAVTQKTHNREALATLLWPEVPPNKSRAGLRTALWSLSKTAIGAWLQTDSDTVLFQADDDSFKVDVLQFRALIAQWRSHAHTDDKTCPACLATLQEAVALYENDFLSGFSLGDSQQFDDWVYFESAELRQQLRIALEKLIELLTLQEAIGDAIMHARRLVALDPLHEPAQYQLMQLYAQAGQHGAALRQFELCSRVLDAELGIAPSAETSSLFERIKRGDYRRPITQIGTFQSSASPFSTCPNNLPPSASRFVGRRTELSAVNQLLADQSTRLITILGPGGMGKTRFVLTVAQQQVAQRTFNDGVFFVPLISIADPNLIVPVIVDALSFQLSDEQREPKQQLFDYLTNKSLLLVLDNFEHLLDGADFVANLLQQAPHVKVIATSREPLNLYDEQRYTLDGLSIEEPEDSNSILESPAMMLFVQCVRRHQPDFVTTAADTETLITLNRLLGGIPLAIELAASRSIALSFAEIVSELEQNLDFLQTNVRNMPTRHRSMRAVIDSSWQGLSTTQRTVFTKLSLFRSGFTKEAASQIADATTEILIDLLNRSLLRFSTRTKRFDMHELLRQHAAEQLSELDAGKTRERFSDYYSETLEQVNHDLRSERFISAMHWLDLEHDNANFAWRLASEGGAITQLLQALEPLRMYYKWRHRPQDGEQLCAYALQQLAPISVKSAEAIDLRVRLLTCQSEFAWFASHHDLARSALQEAQLLLEKTTDQESISTKTHALYLLQKSNIVAFERQDGQAITLNEESLALYRSIDDKWGIAQALDPLCFKARIIGQRERALDLQQECMALRMEIGNPHEIARSHTMLGLFLLHIGRFEEAEYHLNSSLVLFRQLGNRVALIRPLVFLGINHLFCGRFVDAKAVSEESIALNKQLGTTIDLSVANMTIMRGRLNLGQYQAVKDQGQKLLPQYRAINDRWSLGFTLYNLGRLALVEGKLEDAQHYLVESAQLFGSIPERSLAPGALMHLSILAVKQGDKQNFSNYLSEGLQMALSSGPLNPMRFELVAMSLWLLRQDEVELAIELYTAALQSHYIANSRYFADIAGRFVVEAERSLPDPLVAVAKTRGQRRNLHVTASAIQQYVKKQGQQKEYGIQYKLGASE